MRQRFWIAAISAGAAVLSACGSNQSTVTTPTGPSAPQFSAIQRVTTINALALPNYSSPLLPAYYDGTVNALDNQAGHPAISNAVATLGRVLFYDTQLSIDRTVACASCHRQEAGFSDPARFSSGVAGLTTAHSMRLGNVRYYRPGEMFWNRRVGSIEAQAREPIINSIEMGWSGATGGIPALVQRLQALDYYQELFTLAYGNSTVTEEGMQQAIAQFERAMISSESRWDAAYARVFTPNAPNRGLNLDLPDFTDEENRGRQLFMGPGTDCSQCHQPPTFALAANAQGIGLDAGETVVFKAPSLKNVSRGGAFMHDGRFSSLDQVVEHYNSGIQPGPVLDNRLRGPNGNPRRMNLSPADRAAIVAFLRTLNDDSLVNDQRFSRPFR